MTASITSDLRQRHSLNPSRYRSLQTLLLFSIVGSLLSSYWLLPSQLERVTAALERGNEPVVDRELAQAADRPTDPGETRALADVALTLGKPDVAAAIVKQALDRQPDSLTALHHLREIQRQRHRMLDVAALDERIFARAGDPEALREAADIYASQHLVAERIAALRQLNTIGQTTASDIVELAHRLSEGGDKLEASKLVMAWLNSRTDPLPTEVIASAAWLSAAAPDAEDVAARLGALIGPSDDVGAFSTLIQTYTERGRPGLSLITGQALGEHMQAMPQAALLLARLEAQQGKFDEARRRLDVLFIAGTLPPAGLATLAELNLQLGDLRRAATLVGALPSDQMPRELPHRLVDTAFWLGRMDELARMPVEPIAAASPASAAVIALANGDRGLAQALAHRALMSGDVDDLGPAFGGSVKALGLQRDLVALLLSVAKTGVLDDQRLTLLTETSAGSRQVLQAVMQVLRAQRDLTPKAGLLWATTAVRNGGVADVTAWLRTHGKQMPTDTLLGLLQLATERASGELARIAATALSDRPDLPDGWTPAEIEFAALTSEPLTPARLKQALALINVQMKPAAKNRVIASLVGSRDFPTVSRSLDQALVNDGVVDWLVSATARIEQPDVLDAQLYLLASIAPHRAIPSLARNWERNPRRLLPLYVAALIRDHQVDAAQTVLAAGLKPLDPKQQDAVLFDALANVRADETLPLLRIGARSGRGDWVSAFQNGLARAGLVEELRAGLRADASMPGLSSSRRAAIASRLVELNDRVGAITILKELGTGLPPSDPLVQQLVFLWGPREAPDAIEWARDQAMSASRSDLPKWLEHLAYLGSPRTVIDLVDTRPEILSLSASAVRTYGASLIATGRQVKPNLAAAVAGNHPPEVSNALAQLALDTGQAHPAWQATRDALAKAPNDAATLLLAAQSSASVRRSSEAAALYTRLLALGPQDPAIMLDAGDAMLAAKLSEPGRRVVTDALARLSKEPSTLRSARQRARALMLLKRQNEAFVLLEPWLAKFPDDAGLKADMLQARLDGAGFDQ